MGIIKFPIILNHLMDTLLSFITFHLHFKPLIKWAEKYSLSMIPKKGGILINKLEWKYLFPQGYLKELMLLHHGCWEVLNLEKEDLDLTLTLHFQETNQIHWEESVC